MSRRILALAAALALAIISLAAMPLPNGACALAEDARLTVRGSGTVLLEADQATIMVGVRDVAEDVLTAQSSVNQRIEAVVAALLERGIAEADISTSTIGIYPNYDYSDGTERIAGYTAYNTVSAVTGDMEDIGAYIDAAFTAGANTLDGVAFSASDSSAASLQALALALSNARDKAAALAEAAGMELGGIVAITDGNDYSYGGPVEYAKAEAASMDTGTRVRVSRVEISATVTVEFALK